MKFKIPFTFSSTDILKKRSEKFINFFRSKKKGKIEKYLKNTDIQISGAEYLGICLRSFLIIFLILIVIFSSILYFLNIDNFYLYGFLISILFSGFSFFSQVNYPRIYASKKERDIEKNLVSSLQDMLVQLESGVPIYEIIGNIARSNYGYVTEEFKKALKEINSGGSQVDALEDLIKRNNSVYFKRVLWQISNGLRSGSDMSIVIKDSIDNLTKEQTIQIQTYGSKLNPLIMFYMLIAVILPSLGITFLIIISSMVGISGAIVKLSLVGISIFIILLQIMFLGLIKTRRPSLI